MADDRDKEALFEKLYRYYPGVISFLKRFPEFSHEEVRELAQDVFARVYEHMDTYRGESEWGYVQSVAKTVALNERRSRLTDKRRGEAVSLDDVQDLANRSDRAADRQLGAKEVSRRIYQAVLQLPVKYRIIMMHYLSEASYEEMSVELGISVSTVKSRLHAARKQLRELLGEPDGLGVPDDQ